MCLEVERVTCVSRIPKCLANVEGKRAYGSPKKIQIIHSLLYFYTLIISDRVASSELSRL